jgi:glycosyltransferase involved in cell wall biosynthesis
LRSIRRLGVLGHSGSDWGSGFDVFQSNGSAMIENIPLIVENDVRWVVDLEHVGALFGYYGDWRSRLNDDRVKRILTRQLTSRHCRKIIPWTDAAKRTLENILPHPDIAAKTEIVNLAIRPSPPKPHDLERHDPVRILFIGSSNHTGEFWSKGGFEVLESYRRLRQRYGEAVELNFRCWMPDELSSEYGQDPGIRHLPGYLPKEDLDRLFWESDIFLFPSHHTPGMAILEAMRFGLPVVTKDIWANRELVEDGVTGFLVKPSEKVPYYLPGFVPNWSMDRGPFMAHMRHRDDRVLGDLAEKLGQLVEDESLRAKMGQEARRSVEEGRASIKKRNPRLRRIYEEAAKR